MCRKVLRRLQAVFAMMAILISSCSDAPLMERDAGEEAFVRRAVPLMWGRRARDLAELEVLVRISQQSGRDALIRGMARNPEFVEHWTGWLYDALAVNRIGDRSEPRCYDRALLDPEAEAVRSGRLAEAVAGARPDELDTRTAWTMRDLTRSALWAGDLSPVLRAHLFASLAPGKAPPNELEAISQRRALSEIFQATYLGRQMECLSCHNSEFSETDHPDPAYDHSWPLPGEPEAAIFGDSRGPESLDDLSVFFRRRGVVSGFYFLREQPRATPGAEFSSEVGCSPKLEPAAWPEARCRRAVCAQNPYCCEVAWDDTCVAACAEQGACTDWEAGWDGCTVRWPLQRGCAGCGCEEAVCAEEPSCCEEGWSEDCAALCRGVSETACGPDQEALAARWTPWGMDRACGDFVPPWLVESNQSGHRGRVVEDIGDVASVYDLESFLWGGMADLQGLLEAGPVPRQLAPRAGLAWLGASSLVDRVWEEAYGARLTVSHGLPRNRAQRDRLEALSVGFVQSGYDLTKLLMAVVSDPLFNQIAPAELGDQEPAYLPSVLDPWREEANTAGDLIRARSARSLMSETRAALEWGPLELFPSGMPSQPDTRIATDLGAFMEDTAPGFDGIGFQSALVWEDEYGACIDPRRPATTPGCAARAEPDCPGCDCRAQVCAAEPACCLEGWDESCAQACARVGGCPPGEAHQERDFIDRLVAQGTARGATVGEAVVVLKERILSDPLVDETEAGLLAGLVGAPLESPLGPSLEEGLRRACSAFLASPDFLLEGLPVPDRLGTPVPFSLLGATPQERCEEVSQWMEGVVDVRCGPEGVDTNPSRESAMLE